MYQQGYLDQARVRNQYSYYPYPNYAAMSGFDEVKQLPQAYIDGIKAFKPVQIAGAVGVVMLVTSIFVDKNKKLMLL